MSLDEVPNKRLFVKEKARGLTARFFPRINRGANLSQKGQRP
jgi:hypothetical protein